MNPNQIIAMLVSGKTPKISDIKTAFGVGDNDANKLINFFKRNSNSQNINIADEFTKSFKNTGIFNLKDKILGALKLVSGSIGTGIQSMTKVFEGEIREDMVDLTGAVNNFADGIKNLSLLGSVGSVFNLGINSLTNALATAYGAEVEAREVVNRELNLTGKLAENYRDTLVDAYLQSKLMGAEWGDIKEIVSGVATTLGRSRMLTSNTISQIFETQRALGLSNKAIADAAGVFEDISVGVSASVKQVENAGTFARSIGLKVNDYITKLTGNLTLLNQFGFKNGIQGIEKMVARAQSLRMEMKTVTDLAEKVFNPEGAIELSANLQAIGGALGDFADPLKLVYQATNDVEGLQNSLIEAAKSLTTFNKESGRFEIVGTNLRRARDMAQSLGISVEELTNLGVRAAQKMEAMSQIDMFGKNLSPEQKEFLSNMSEMKGGHLVISLPDGIKDQFGDAAKDGFLEISKINTEQTEKLKSLMDDYNKNVNKKTNELIFDQTGELKAIKNLVNSIVLNLGISANRSSFAKSGKSAIREYTNPRSAKEISKITDNAIKEMGEDIKNLYSDPTKLMGKITDIFKSSFNQIKNVKTINNFANSSISNNSSVSNLPPVSDTDSSQNGDAPLTKYVKKEKVEIDLNIKTNQSLFDEMTRQLLRDPSFIAEMKEKIMDLKK